MIRSNQNLQAVLKTRSPKKSLEGVDPLKKDEVREFEVDIERYGARCKIPLKTFYASKYYIKAGEGGDMNFPRHGFAWREDAIIYIAALKKESLDKRNPVENIKNLFEENKYLAARSCAEGKFEQSNLMITNSKVEDETENTFSAQSCGLSTLLSYLCYRDREVEPSIKGIGIGYDFAIELNKPTFFAKKAGKRLKELAEKNCKRINKVINDALPVVGARSYVSASMYAGFQKILTFNKKPEDNDEDEYVLAVKTADMIENFKKNPPKKDEKTGQLIDPVLDPFLVKHGKEWFFCKTNDESL